MQDSCQEEMKAANFRIALKHLKVAWDALIKTDRVDLGKRLKKIGKLIVSDAFKTLPEDLAKQLTDYRKQK